MHFKRIAIYMLLGLLLTLIIIFSLWNANRQQAVLQQNENNNIPAGTEEPLTIVATFFPVRHFAEQVVGTNANDASPTATLVTVVPSNTEPHDFEPTPKNIATIEEADLFLVNGGEVDAWAEELQRNVQQNGGKVVNMMECLGGDVNAADPHIWLDPLLVQQEVGCIRDVLIALDPEHAQTYQQRTRDYLDELNVLHTEYSGGLETCSLRTIIVSHDAFGYLGRRYEIEVLPIAGISPESEPSSQDIANLSALANERGIEHIFFETLASPELAETIAEEVGAETLVLNPFEGLTEEEIAAGESYLSVMRDNLANLSIAMQCE